MLGLAESISAVASLLERIINWADKDPETLRQLKLLKAKEDLLEIGKKIDNLLEKVKND